MTSYENNVNMSIASNHHFVRLKNSSIITNSESAIKDCHYFPLCFKHHVIIIVIGDDSFEVSRAILSLNLNLTYFTSNNLSLNYRTKQRTSKLKQIQTSRIKKNAKSMEQSSYSSSFENIWNMKHTLTRTPVDSF